TGTSCAGGLSVPPSTRPDVKISSAPSRGNQAPKGSQPVESCTFPPPAPSKRASSSVPRNAGVRSSSRPPRAFRPPSGENPAWRSPPHDVGEAVLALGRGRLRPQQRLEAPHLLQGVR